MSRSGNVWDNAMEISFSSLKTEYTARKTYRTRDQDKVDVFDYIGCFYVPKRRHSTIGYLSPAEFEMQAGVNRTGCRPHAMQILRIWQVSLLIDLVRKSREPSHL